VEAAPPKPPRPWWHQVVAVGVGALVLIAALTLAPSSFVGLFGIFALAGVVGYYVVWNVTHALHTPLMSVTNAISGIIVVGAMTQLASDDYAVKIVAFVAVLLASINVFGGFTVTARMLNMFKKG
jgi:NAD(P) transhydrogenase subunit alpha